MTVKSRYNNITVPVGQLQSKLLALQIKMFDAVEIFGSKIRISLSIT